MDTAVNAKELRDVCVCVRVMRPLLPFGIFSDTDQKLYIGERMEIVLGGHYVVRWKSYYLIFLGDEKLIVGT